MNNNSSGKCYQKKKTEKGYKKSCERKESENFISEIGCLCKDKKFFKQV